MQLRNRGSYCKIVLILILSYSGFIAIREFIGLSLLDASSLIQNLERTTFSWSDFTCNKCNNFTYEDILLNENFCAKNELYVLYMVLSTHGERHSTARKAIRETWASVNLHKGLHIKTLFVFGAGDAGENTLLRQEQDQHGDILQGNFVDTYTNLTRKVIYGLNWVQRYCSDAKFVIKTDDDSLHVPGREIDYLTQQRRDPFIGGRCIIGVTERDPDDLAYVPVKSYELLLSPIFCQGGGYILSQNAVREIVRTADSVPFHPMEDVFISGMCRIVSGLRYTQVPGVLPKYTDLCKLKNNAIIMHKVTPKDIYDFWDIINHDKDVCGIANSYRILVVVTIILLFSSTWVYFLLNLFRDRSLNMHEKI